MIRRPPRSTPLYSSAASDVYKRQFLPRSPHPRPGGVRLVDALRRDAYPDGDLGGQGCRGPERIGANPDRRPEEGCRSRALSRLTKVSIHKEGTFVANPVLSRPDTWTHNLSQGQAPQQPYDQSYGAQYRQPYAQYGQQSGQPPMQGQQPYTPSAPQNSERMSVDDVITKTAITCL